MPSRAHAICAAVAALCGATASGATLSESPTLRQQATAYEHGEGVARDYAKAVTLYCQAAAQGDAEAMFNLAWMYANGRGVERDDATAAHLLQQAAARGLDVAPPLLARLGTANTTPPACLLAPPSIPIARAEMEPASDIEPAAPAIIAPSAPPAIANLVNQLAPEYQVHPGLALVIMQAESGFDPKALSPKNAQGLMQLIPETSARFNVKNPFDPRQNIRGGLAYLRWLLAYFEGDLALVAAAYNAGEGAVERHLGVPPYEETRRYVRRVLERYGRSTHAFDPKVTPPSARLELFRKPRGSR